LIELTPPEGSILALLLIGLGAVAGAYGYYRYANHMFMTYPEFIIVICQYKIAKRDQQKYEANAVEYGNSH